MPWLPGNPKLAAVAASWHAKTASPGAPPYGSPKDASATLRLVSFTSSHTRLSASSFLLSLLQLHPGMLQTHSAPLGLQKYHPVLISDTSCANASHSVTPGQQKCHRFLIFHFSRANASHSVPAGQQKCYTLLVARFLYFTHECLTICATWPAEVPYTHRFSHPTRACNSKPLR